MYPFLAKTAFLLGNRNHRRMYITFLITVYRQDSGNQELFPSHHSFSLPFEIGGYWGTDTEMYGVDNHDIHF